MTAKLAKAYLMVETGERIDCLYNPESVSVTRTNSWKSNEMAGRGVARMEYTGSTPGSMSLSLIFDTTATGASVNTHTDKILKLMEPDPNIAGSDEGNMIARPPTVTFHWGDVHSFEAVVLSANITFDYFSSDAVPLRATVALSLQQYVDPTPRKKQNPTSGTPRPSRSHRVQPGETLDRISARYYGDATRWRLLASANGLEDPLALKPGALIDIPRLDG